MVAAPGRILVAVGPDCRAMSGAGHQTARSVALRPIILVESQASGSSQANKSS